MKSEVELGKWSVQNCCSFALPVNHCSHFQLVLCMPACAQTRLGEISWHLPPVGAPSPPSPGPTLGADPAHSCGREGGMVLPPRVCNTLSVAPVSLARCGAGAVVTLLHNSSKGSALTLLMSHPHPSIPRVGNVEARAKNFVLGAGRMDRGTWRGRRCCQWKWTAWGQHGEPARIPGGGEAAADGASLETD